MEFKIFTSGEPDQNGNFVPTVFFGGISIPVTTAVSSSKASAEELATAIIKDKFKKLFQEKL